MWNYIQLLFNTFDLKFGNFSFPVQYWMAAAIVILSFLMILSMAQLRKHSIDWSLKGSVTGIFVGFLLALLIEGFLLVGGKTILTEVLGWKNPPKPLSLALDAGKTKLVQVLGINTQIPSSLAKDNVVFKDVIGIIQSLTPTDLKKVKSIICVP
jgi:hypothetical protein